MYYTKPVHCSRTGREETEVVIGQDDMETALDSQSGPVFNWKQGDIVFIQSIQRNELTTFFGYQTYVPKAVRTIVHTVCMYRTYSMYVSYISRNCILTFIM